MTKEELRAARAELGLSAEKLAARIGERSKGRTIRRWERGDLPVPEWAAISVNRELRDHRAR